VKVRSATFNNRRRDFTIRVGASEYRFPYSRLGSGLVDGDSVVSAAVDPEIGREGFSYTTESGRTGTVHVEQVLDYNHDPAYLRGVILYEMTLAAQARLERAGLSRRELARRMGTSPTQLYRLLDQTNARKSVDRMLALLSVLDCEVEMRVRPRRPPAAAAAIRA
jgi:predicted XRE-type DNA-binding protein